MRPKPQLKPGWRMTEDQHRLYWRLINQAWKAHRASTLAACGAILTQEQFRALIHERAFGWNISAKDIDRMKMFGDFKAACLAIIAPDNLNVQVQIEGANSVKARLVHRIITSFPATYILGMINSPRFAHCSSVALEDLEGWTEKDLTDLRNTLCARDPQPVAAPDPEPALEEMPF